MWRSITTRWSLWKSTCCSLAATQKRLHNIIMTPKNLVCFPCKQSFLFFKVAHSIFCSYVILLYTKISTDTSLSQNYWTINCVHKRFVSHPPMQVNVVNAQGVRSAQCSADFDEAWPEHDQLAAAHNGSFLIVSARGNHSFINIINYDHHHHRHLSIIINIVITYNFTNFIINNGGSLILSVEVIGILSLASLSSSSLIF